MKKKIIFVAFCLILFLVFTSLSYGGPDPRRPRFLGHPWGHMKSPSLPENPNTDLVLIAIGSDFALLLSLPHLDDHSGKQKMKTQNNQFNQPKFGD